VAELTIAMHLGEHLSGEHLTAQSSVWSVPFRLTNEGEPDTPEAVGSAVEEAVSRAAWLADEALRLGYLVRLITDEIGVSHVADAAEVGRRLARYEWSDAPSPDGRDRPLGRRGDDVLEVTRFGIRVLGPTTRL
jgi:hypothetical protein